MMYGIILFRNNVMGEILKNEILNRKIMKLVLIKRRISRRIWFGTLRTKEYCFCYNREKLLYDGEVLWCCEGELVSWWDSVMGFCCRSVFPVEEWRGCYRPDLAYSILRLLKMTVSITDYKITFKKVTD